MIRNKEEQTKVEHLEEILACRRMWASVMRTAADDLHRHHLRDQHDGTRPDGLRAQALAWINSEEVEVGSFLWCCDILDLNSTAVREEVRNGSVLRSNGKYASLLKEYNLRVRGSLEDPD